MPDYGSMYSREAVQKADQLLQKQKQPPAVEIDCGGKRWVFPSVEAARKWGFRIEG